MQKKFRSLCPIASTLDLLGDKWSLVLIRDMLIFGKKTYKEFALSDEGIATGILASRLKLLESFGLITKRKLPNNKKENIYLLTEKGIGLAPTIIEITLWGDRHMREHNPEIDSYEYLKADKGLVITTVQENYRQIVVGLIG